MSETNIIIEKYRKLYDIVKDFHKDEDPKDLYDRLQKLEFYLLREIENLIFDKRPDQCK